MNTESTGPSAVWVDALKATAWVVAGQHVWP